MLKWWIILYWPVMFALLAVGKYTEKRYPEGSDARRRADTAGGCILIAMPSAPLVLLVGWLIVENIRSTTTQAILAVAAFLIGWTLVYGALIN
jgi:hypothetical protein